MAVMLNAILQLESQEGRESATEAVLMLVGLHIKRNTKSGADKVAVMKQRGRPKRIRIDD